MHLVEVFKAGTHTDNRGRTREYSLGDVNDIVSGYVQGSAPLFIKHDESGETQGSIAEVFRFGDSVLARVDNASPEFSSLFKGGEPWQLSVKLGLGDDGKWQLRHMAAVPKGAVDLLPAEFSDDSEDSVFTAEFSQELAINGMALLADQIAFAMRSLREILIAPPLSVPIETINEAIPNWRIDDIARIAEMIREYESSTPVSAFSSSPIIEDENVSTDALKAAEERAEAAEAALESREAEFARREQKLAIAEFEVFADKLMEPGRVFDKKLAAQIYGTLPDDEAEFSASSDGKEEKIAGSRGAFKALLESIPIAVEFGEKAPAGDQPKETSEYSVADIKGIADKYIADQAANGVVVSIPDAYAHAGRTIGVNS